MQIWPVQRFPATGRRVRPVPPLSTQRKVVRNFDSWLEIEYVFSIEKSQLD
jgi:hypothetical protein